MFKSFSVRTTHKISGPHSQGYVCTPQPSRLKCCTQITFTNKYGRVWTLPRPQSPSPQTNTSWDPSWFVCMRSLREPPGRPRRPGDGEAKDPLTCVGREVAPLSRPLPTLTTDPTHTHITHAGMHTCYQDTCRSHTHTHTHTQSKSLTCWGNPREWTGGIITIERIIIIGVWRKIMPTKYKR